MRCKAPTSATYNIEYALSLVPVTSRVAGRHIIETKKNTSSSGGGLRWWFETRERCWSALETTLRLWAHYIFHTPIVVLTKRLDALFSNGHSGTDTMTL